MGTCDLLGTTFHHLEHCRAIWAWAPPQQIVRLNKLGQGSPKEACIDVNLRLDHLLDHLQADVERTLHAFNSCSFPSLHSSDQVLGPTVDAKHVTTWKPVQLGVCRRL